MKILLAITLLIPYLLFAQEDTLFIKRNFLGSNKIEKEYSVLKSDTSVMHGSYTSYHYNGRLFLKGRYHYGKRDGEWTSYHENGTMESHTYYREGQYCNVWEYYSNEGILESSFNMDLLTDTSQIIAKDIKYYHITIDYPERARENGIEGTVELIILTDSACHIAIQLLKGFDYECDHAALQAVRKGFSKIELHDCKNASFICPINFRLPQ